MTPESNDVRIAPVPVHLRRGALELVFADLPDEECDEQVALALAEAEGNDAALQGLFCARTGKRVLGAALAQVQPGRTAAVWLPRLAPGVAPTTAHVLMAAACGWLEGQDVVLAQTLLATVPADDRNVLEAARFTHLAEMLYLVAPSDQYPEHPPAGMLQLRPAGRVGYERLAAVVEGTYTATRDCAALDGVRQIDDVLAGYRAAGCSGADEWYLVQGAGEDVGCLILADHPRQGNLELVYMGVLPEWRGHGWGVEVARWAQWRARRLGRDRLVLAVDAENGPALAAYAAAGCAAWDRRSAYLRAFGS